MKINLFNLHFFNNLHIINCLSFWKIYSILDVYKKASNNESCFLKSSKCFKSEGVFANVQIFTFYSLYPIQVDKTA